MTDRRRQFLLLITSLLLVVSCGGGGDSGPPVVTNSPPPPPPPPPTPTTTSIELSSDAGDYIGGGSSYAYDKSDADISLRTIGDRLVIDIEGDEVWHADFEPPAGNTFVQVGTYENLTLYGLHDPAIGGMSWTGEGRACTSVSGRFIVNSVEYDNTTLTEIDFDFEQYCDGSGAALRGNIYWNLNDTTSPPGPVVPPPGSLWEPAAGTVPDTGNYAYLESQSGDFIGGGANYLYTGASAILSANGADGHLSVSIESTERWMGDFQVMNVLSRLEAGYYPDLQRYPFHNPVKGGLNWTGEGRGCDDVTGWFVIDSVTYDLTTLTAIELRFEQHCDGGGPALYGAIRWDASDTTSPTAPIFPPPAGLWEPDPGATPDTGTYAYLNSEPGDYIGQGGVYLYTQADTQFTVYANGSQLDFNVDGDESWRSSFAGMNTLSRLEVGYYGGLERFPFHNPAVGGLTWGGEGRGCNQIQGWFVVDSVTYDGPVLVAIELRFEQSCEVGLIPLHGEIHWDATDPTVPSGPINPPPVGIWEPAPGITPATGTYVYLESEPGDFIGRGASYTYTQTDSILSFDDLNSSLEVVVDGDEGWHGNFQVMSSVTRLEPGFYGELQRWPFHNPARGGITWSGEARGCNRLDGWFVVDSVAYDGNTLTQLELRFEQHCEGFVPALRGALRWDASDTSSPPGPVVPPPAGLWEPAPGITPPTGNYAYFESEPGDFVGAGGNYLHTDDDSVFTVDAPGSRMRLAIDGAGDANWHGDFEPMEHLSRLEPGYYPDLRRYPFHNPAKGGMTVSGFIRGCNQLSGWYVVDQVTYDGVTLTGIDLRFEQHCEFAGPALHGEIHWRQ
jgi:hypothetical protein